MTVHRVTLAEGADVEGFRRAVRRLAHAGVPPADVSWTRDGAPDLFGADVAADVDMSAPPIAMPGSIARLVDDVACHADRERWALLYTLLWRVHRGERALATMASDPLVHRLGRMRDEVRRELHRMHAFLRFRRDEQADDERFVAWFEPAHFILEAAAPFFVQRFRGMRWSILTPRGSLHWDRTRLEIGPAARRDAAPDGDEMEAAWCGYYESIFNPARVNPSTMRGHMPARFWANMPEARSIPSLVRGSIGRVAEMIERDAVVPTRRDPAKAVAAMARQHPRSLAELARIVAAAPPMVEGGVRAVLGEGQPGAAIAFVGEQPGDQEDLQGRPFVGPAGRLLDQALAEAGIARDRCYVTNAVKHFKFERRGARRLHRTPTATEVAHYRWWLDLELGFVAPRVVVALGATALLALTGQPLDVTSARGPLRFGVRAGFATLHPASLLRLTDVAARARGFARFVADLRQVAEIARAGDGSGRLEALESA
jgi:probable DNA metabolism protein